MSKLIYVAKPGNTVFESQVVHLLLEIKNQNYFDEIVLLLGLKSLNSESLYNHILTKDLKVITFKLYPNYNFFNRSQAIVFRKIFDDLVDDETVIHTRSEVFAKSIKSALQKNRQYKAKILTDIRGALYEETLFYNKGNIFLKALKLYQHRRNLLSLKRTTDIISCVSSELKKYVIEFSGMDKESVVVNHCCAGRTFRFNEKLRIEYRNKLELMENDILFLFSTGDDSGWQNTEQIVLGIANRGYKVLNLSKRRIENKNVKNLFVPYNEVPYYLCAVDIAVVWRNDDIVNNVASPVKFSEYVCTGLPIIANNGVILINEYIEKTGYGKIIKSFNEIDEDLIKLLMVLDRVKIGEYGEKNYSVKGVAKEYLKMYELMLANC